MADGTVARSVRLRIEGRVQGVGFRVFVERNALRLGIDGWVRNRRDGGVEVSLHGPRTGIDEMIARCRQGPPGGNVEMVKVLDESAPRPAGFEILPTV